MSISHEIAKLQEHLENLKQEKKITKRDSPRWIQLLDEIEDLEGQLEHMQDNYSMHFDMEQ